MASKGRILVVDDERRNVMLLSIRLRALGYEVLEAESGEQALALARDHYVDVVLTDVMMPGIDGLELTRRLKADPAQAEVPVVLITALDDVKQRTRGLEAGADDFLGKPVNPAELELRVRGQVRLRQLQQELRGRIEVLGGQAATAGRVTGGKVFVVEDDAQWRNALCRRLVAQGHAVTSAEDLRTGLASVDGADPDVVIVDLCLPDGSGVDFIRQFRESRSGNHVPTILVVSAIEDAKDKLDALRSGADDYLVKPVAPEELEARIQAQLHRSRTSRALRDQVYQARLAASKDALTGLFNRRFLDEDLARRIERAAAGQHSFSLAMLDVDHFKRINDTHGHGVGDAVLRALAACVGAAMRESNLVCRYGGEELCLVLPATRLDDAVLCLERLRADVERLACPPLATGAITVSAGVAEWAPGETPGDVLRRADGALYAAKRAGRNRVEVSAPGADVSR